MTTLSRVFLQPHQTFTHLIVKAFPRVFFERNARSTALLGVSRPTAVLSFDCDTAKDAEVVVQVHSKLAELGVPVTYAVPGRLLQEGEKSYLSVLRSGGIFINHGGNTHTEVNPLTGLHISTFFYDQVGAEAVAADFNLGHDLVADFCGVAPRGFRSPHFGTYSSKRNLKFIHSLASEKEYLYSSSSTPYWAFRWGPVRKSKDLIEIPVSGRSSSPLTIVDSWSAFGSPEPSISPSQYFDELEGWVCAAREFGPVVLNIYADPSHIFDQPIFFSAIKLLAEVFTFVTLEELAEAAVHG